MNESSPDLDLTTMERELPHANRLRRGEYEAELLRLQIELVKLQTWVRDRGERVAILFEGRWRYLCVRRRRGKNDWIEIECRATV